MRPDPTPYADINTLLDLLLSRMRAHWASLKCTLLMQPYYLMPPVFWNGL